MGQQAAGGRQSMAGRQAYKVVKAGLGKVAWQKKQACSGR